MANRLQLCGRNGYLNTRLWRPLAIGVLVACSATTTAQEAKNMLTIYSSAQPGAIAPQMYRPAPGHSSYAPQHLPGYAVVRHRRSVQLTKGRGTLRFTDVAGLIDPTTVRFTSLTDPDNTRVLEQNFQFDLVSTDKVLEKYIDRTVTLDQVMGDQMRTLTGRLLSAAGGLTLAGEDGQIHLVKEYENIRLGELPGGLITRPTLVWDMQARRGGQHDARVAYQTEGITWWADYNIVFSEGRDANTGMLDVGAWVSIINQSGGSYPDARLKLIAGDVHRAPAADANVRQQSRVVAMSKMLEEDGGFDEKAFFEFHLYTLGRLTSLPDNSTKQIELFPAAKQVPAQKLLVYYGLAPQFRHNFGAPMTDRDFGTQSNKKVDVYLRFANDKNHGLGVPLPAGRIRVSKLDSADDSLEFIGEDVIDHTPKDERVTIKLGSAFDVVGERKQVNYKVNTAQKWVEEEIEIRLRNHKDAPVEVIVKENLYRWLNWQMLENSHKYDKQDARTVHFPVRVARDGETVVRYTVRYSW